MTDAVYNRMRPALMGGVSLAVLALAVVVVIDRPVELLLPQGAQTGPTGQPGTAAQYPEALARSERDGSEPAPDDAVQGYETRSRIAPAVEEGAVRRDGRAPLADAIAPEPSTGIAAEQEAFAPPPAPPPSLAKQSLRLTAPAAGSAAQPMGRAVGNLMPAPDAVAPAYREQGRDRFENVADNPVKRTAEAPVSTFSIDVDTASYAFMRRALMEGVLPQPDAVRVEELVNYFAYDYPAPQSAETPFAAHVAVIPTPWNEGTRLVRIGLKGYEIPQAERPRANLVFLIDTSGSMNAPDKLPLLVNSFRLLLEKLGPQDRVAIVAYAGSAGTVLEPTPASDRGRIMAALDRLSAGGSTAGGEGIRQAYALAEQGFEPGGVNRVILATDGDFNVGIQNTEELKGFVERKRDSGVLLSVMGFGQGNYNDALMQALAQNGNGQAAYIDTLSEARKVLVEEASGTLFPIAQDVKIQVEFNPAAVAEYRLIGYETRALAREDFNNDRVDAGEIGSGHRVTALYEITPVGSGAGLIDPLRYGTATDAGVAAAREAEYGFLRLRYKRPGESESRLIERPITPDDTLAPGDPMRAEADWAAAVAGFGQLLRGGRYTGDFGYDEVIALAQGARGPDPYGYRAEFLNLVRLAKSAAAMQRPQ